MTSLRGVARRAGRLVIALLAACDARTESPTPGASAPGPRTGAVPARETPDSAATSSLPAPLDGACLRGDAAIGTAFALEGAPGLGLPLPRLALGAMEARDSARLVARLARTVDALPSATADTAETDFRGLPVVVLAAWRVLPATDDTIVVALVARRLPIESAPLQELHFLITEPDPQPGLRGALGVRWATREVDHEESVVARELVQVTQRGDTVVLVVAHEAHEGIAAELVERVGRRWRLAWRGRLSPCSAQPGGAP